MDLGDDPAAEKEEDGDSDFGDGDFGDGNEAAYSDGGGDGLLVDLIGDRNALIFMEDDVRRSYSSIRFVRSSSDLIVIKASRSSVGN